MEMESILEVKNYIKKILILQKRNSDLESTLILGLKE